MPNVNDPNYLTTDDEFENMKKDLYSPLGMTEIRLPYRQIRAERITAEIMRILARHVGPDENNTLKRIHQDISDMFFKADVDIVTEIDRLEAGLPRRGAYGITPEDLAFMELRKKQIMYSMVPGFLGPKKDDGNG